MKLKKLEDQIFTQKTYKYLWFFAGDELIKLDNETHKNWYLNDIYNELDFEDIFETNM